MLSIVLSHLHFFSLIIFICSDFSCVTTSIFLTITLILIVAFGRSHGGNFVHNGCFDSARAYGG